MAVITLSSGLVFQRILVVKPQTLDQLVQIHKLRGGGDSYTRIVQVEEAIFALWVRSRGHCLGMVGRRVEVIMMGAKPEEASQEPIMAVSGLFWQVCGKAAQNSGKSLPFSRLVRAKSPTNPRPHFETMTQPL
jgi:hypothetical protein